MKTQAAKRVKRKVQLEDFLDICFGTECRWIACYFCIALECDYPIVEAILFTSYTKTKVTPNGLQNNTFLLLLFKKVKSKIRALCGPARQIPTNGHELEWKHTVTKAQLYLDFDVALSSVSLILVRKYVIGNVKCNITFTWKECAAIHVSRRDIVQTPVLTSVTIPWLHFSSVLEEKLHYLISEFKKCY